MDRENTTIERDVDMAIAKEPKNSVKQNNSIEHNLKVSKSSEGGHLSTPQTS